MPRGAQEVPAVRAEQPGHDKSVIIVSVDRRPLKPEGILRRPERQPDQWRAPIRTKDMKPKPGSGKASLDGL